MYMCIPDTDDVSVSDDDGLDGQSVGTGGGDPTEYPNRPG